MDPSATFAGPRRFNHVGLSVPAELLDEQGRADLCAYYGEVFGWTELPTMTLDRQRLVLSVGSFDQFVFLIADPEPMRCQRMDHVGMAVDTREEFDTMVDRLRSWASRDERVDFIDHDVEDHGVLKLHNTYARFLLPLMVEVQWFEMAG
jgi:hypothetical protein